MPSDISLECVSCPRWRRNLAAQNARTKQAASRRGLLAFAGPGFNVLTLRALEREQFAARALSLNAKQQHCRPAFGAVGRVIELERAVAD